MNKNRREFACVIYFSQLGIFYSKILYLETTRNKDRGNTPSRDTEEIKKTSLERFRKIETNKVVYWGLSGHQC